MCGDVAVFGIDGVCNADARSDVIEQTARGGILKVVLWYYGSGARVRKLWRTGWDSTKPTGSQTASCGFAVSKVQTTNGGMGAGPHVMVDMVCIRERSVVIADQLEKTSCVVLGKGPHGCVVFVAEWEGKWRGRGVQYV